MVPKVGHRGSGEAWGCQFRPTPLEGCFPTTTPGVTGQEGEAQRLWLHQPFPHGVRMPGQLGAGAPAAAVTMALRASPRGRHHGLTAED